MEHFLAEISALTETTQPTLMFFSVGIVRNHDSVWWPQLLPSRKLTWNLKRHAVQSKTLLRSAYISKSYPIFGVSHVWSVFF